MGPKHQTSTNFQGFSQLGAAEGMASSQVPHSVRSVYIQ